MTKMGELKPIDAVRQPLTMCSTEIADLCAKQHDNVLRDIRKMLVDLGLDAISFEGIYRDAYGRSKRCFNLPKTLTVTLITGYRAELRYKVVKRLEELENSAEAFDPATVLESPAQMRKLLLAYTEKVISLEAAAEEMREDVEAHKRLTAAAGSLSVTEAAKALPIRRKDLLEFMSENGWIYRRPGGPWLGYQTKCNQGLLEHKTTTLLRADGSEKITEQVRVTPKGLSKLSKIIHPTARLVP